MLALALDNRDHRFSPENDDDDNPLAGKIQPPRKGTNVASARDVVIEIEVHTIPAFVVGE